MHAITRTIRAITLGTLLVAGAVASAQTPKMEQSLRAMKIEQRLGNKMPFDARVMDEYGQEIKLGTLFNRGRPVVVLPIFYRCEGVCGKEADTLLKTIVKMKDYTVGEDFDVLFMSIHPRETPELAMTKEVSILKIYDRPTAAEGFHFLTGHVEMPQAAALPVGKKQEKETELRLQEIKRFTTALGFNYEYDAEEDRINHPAGLMVLTPDGRVSQYFYGVEYPTKALKSALDKAAKGEIGEEADVILFGCIMIDRATGQRTIVFNNVVRLVAALFAVGVFSWIGMMTYKNRRTPLPRGSETHGGEDASG